MVSVECILRVETTGFDQRLNVACKKVSSMWLALVAENAKLPIIELEKTRVICFPREYQEFNFRDIMFKILISEWGYKAISQIH